MLVRLQWRKKEPPSKWLDFSPFRMPLTAVEILCPVLEEEYPNVEFAWDLKTITPEES